MPVRRSTCATILASVLVLSLALLSPPGLSFADPLDTWHWRNPLPQGNTLRGVAYANGTFVTVGEFGTILTSPDGVAWTQRVSGTTAPLFGIAYGNNTFVAVGGNGTIVTSPDGVAWTQRTPDIASSLSGIAYSNNTFVAAALGIIQSDPVVPGQCTLPPGQATLVLPSGTITTTTPTYTWNAVPCSSWYYLWVNDSTGTRVQEWYTAAQASCASGTGTCSVTPSLSLTNGSAQWWAQTWDDAGYAPWSSAMNFSVSP